MVRAPTLPSLHTELPTRANLLHWMAQAREARRCQSSSAPAPASGEQVASARSTKETAELFERLARKKADRNNAPRPALPAMSAHLNIVEEKEKLVRTPLAEGYVPTFLHAFDDRLPPQVFSAPRPSSASQRTPSPLPHPLPLLALPWLIPPPYFPPPLPPVGRRLGLWTLQSLHLLSPDS